MVLEADYLIVGSGAVGLAFADVLIHETDSTVALVDRHHAPGGHWNDAYPFVRLHQPSATYGVNSLSLGDGGRDTTPWNLGMCRRDSSATILSYYEQLMTGFLATGRVRYFPLTDYQGDYDQAQRLVSLLDGRASELRVRERTVDTSYLGTEVPSTHPPKYEVAEGVRCIPPNLLPRQARPPSGYVVIGAGKTGIDVCLWLLQNGVAPGMISWIVPRDPWLQNRAKLQPAEEFFEQTFTAFAVQVEIAATATTVEDLFARLEAAGQLLRLDPAVDPGMYHGATVSEAELAALRQIRSVIRMGRVQRLEPDRIVLDDGTVGSDPRRLYIDCSARGVAFRPALPVFEGRKITPQMVRPLQPVFSSALIAHIEATVADEAEKNELCAPFAMTDQPRDWLSAMLFSLAAQARWRQNPDLREWLVHSRLDTFSGLARNVSPTDDARLALLHRYGTAASAAPANLQRLIAAAMPVG
ncbi:NAD(P)-binding protein [Sinomonas terrae]|uniref:NAD(P)-binding protein n=1 Tax=Sinomonas terrae TaxID=2908838 RepID=A0ABS9TZI5_9MICC|nr:NAD(P)-binding protein [Sinomonas terrae]MCH6469851.1 NAD(P)-binding protein [Sinomonas terrae]